MALPTLRATAGCHALGEYAYLYIPDSSGNDAAEIQVEVNTFSTLPREKFIPLTDSVRMKYTGKEHVKGPIYLVLMRHCSIDITPQGATGCDVYCRENEEWHVIGADKEKKAFCLPKANLAIVEMTSFCELVAGIVSDGNARVVMYERMREDHAILLAVKVIRVTNERFDNLQQDMRRDGWTPLRHGITGIDPDASGDFVLRLDGTSTEQWELSRSDWRKEVRGQLAEFPGALFILGKSTVTLTCSQDGEQKIEWENVALGRNTSTSPLAVNVGHSEPEAETCETDREQGQPLSTIQQRLTTYHWKVLRDFLGTPAAPNEVAFAAIAPRLRVTEVNDLFNDMARQSGHQPHSLPRITH